MTTHVTVVEDDPKIRANIESLFKDQGFVTLCVSSVEDLLRGNEAFKTTSDLLVLDVRLPGMSGVEFVRHLAAEGDLPPTIMISGVASVAEAVDALHHGVYDFLEKPFSGERLLRTVRNTLDAAGLRREVEELRDRVAERSKILGESECTRRLRHVIERTAAFDSGVLILGESGTGKELVADALHLASARSSGPLVKVNCAALPPNLVEDVLFGHAKGAYTDAATAKGGVFEEAHGGVLFLDEIGDMELGLQSRLLRVLEDGVVRRLGDSHDRLVDVRVVAATNQNLTLDVAEKRFRDDLYYRLAHLVIDVPPLRDRRSDIVLLFGHFMADACRRLGQPPRQIERETENRLTDYSWPGNVRELKNLCERLVVLGADPIRPEDLPKDIRPGRSEPTTDSVEVRDPDEIITLREYRRQCETVHIRRVLERCRWNFTKAADHLGVQRTYLHRKAAELGITRPEV